MAAQEEGDPFDNPVGARRGLRLVEVDGREAQTVAVRKVIESQVEVVTRLSVIDADLFKLGAAMVHGFARIEARLGLPEMRRADDSLHVILDRAQRLSESVKSKAEQIVADPQSDLTPEVIADLFRAEVKEALLVQREEDRVKQLEAAAAKAEVDRLAAVAKAEADRVAVAKKKEDDQKALDRAKEVRSADRREFKRLVYSGIIVGLVLLAAATSVGIWQGRLMERASPAVAPATTVAPSTTVVLPPAVR